MAIKLQSKIRERTGSAWNVDRIVAGGPSSQWVAGIRSMGAGDYLEVKVKQSSGGTRTISGFCKFTLIKIK